MAISKYRPDIDGLRAVAVLLVLMFHLGLGVPGGYVGVDVFFVISGYLITGIIKSDIEQGDFSFGGFYARRARRILPALLVVLLFSSVAALIILLPSDLERYAKSVAAAFLSVSNFWFWSQGGYFGSAAEMAPLLHTWSLAVEEQFYILLPMTLLLLYRWAPRWIGRLLLLAFVGTFAASAWFVSTRTPEVFYFSPFRAWELLLGSLLAMHRLPGITSNLHRQWIAALGLLLIIVPAFILTSRSLFPGPAAALPCIGAALLIWIGTSGESVTTKLLESRVLVFIGLISYSLYLWHWPLLVFTKHVVGEILGLDARLGIGLASLVLATFSWRFIETPFRSRLRITTRQAWVFSSATVALLGGMVVTVVLSHGLQNRFTPEVAALDRARTRELVRSECINLRVPLNANTVCRIGATDGPTVLVWGDSYAHAMLPAFDAAFKRMGVAAWFAAETGCPPLPTARVSFQGRDNWRCREFNHKMVNFVGTQPLLNQVVLAAAWDSYTNEASGYQLRVNGAGDSATALKQSLEVLLQQLGVNGENRSLIVVGQVPTYGWSVPYKMLLSQLKGEPIAPLKRVDWREKSVVSRSLFEQLAGAQRITFIESADWFCATGACRYATDQDQPLYWDSGHINPEGARFITPMLESGLRSTRHSISYVK
jgi:peptidoglycan/LPS O-acetylase OafA/YrhL